LFSYPAQQTHRNIDSLDFERRAGVEQVMSEHEVVSIEVPHRVVANSVGPVVDCLGDFDACDAVELVQTIGIADEEINRAGLRAGAGRSFRQENPDVAEVYAGESRRLAPGERLPEPELPDVESDRCWDVADGEAGVELVAFDERRGPGW